MVQPRESSISPVLPPGLGSVQCSSRPDLPGCQPTLHGLHAPLCYQSAHQAVHTECCHLLKLKTSVGVIDTGSAAWEACPTGCPHVHGLVSTEDEPYSLRSLEQTVDYID